ncbi:MAG: S8 family serine peptidase [Actinoplanes sp.]
MTTWALADDGTATKASAEPVQLVIGYKNAGTPSTAAKTLAAAGARAAASGLGAKTLGTLNASTVQVSKKSSASLIASLRQDPNVEYVEVDRVRHATLIPNDPVFAEGLQPEVNEVYLPAAWDRTTGSAVKIAVVDTGVTPAGDLAGAVLPGFDFVNNDYNAADDLTENGVIVGHGTLAASLIAARGNNDAGMAGGCWTCTILPVKVLNSKGGGTDSNVAKGIVWATQQGAKIINLSLGGPGTSTVLTNAVNYANDRGVLVVAAAGNENTPTESYPAAYPDVLSVGATARGTSTREPYSNFNSGTKRWVDVAAPGNITAMDPHGNYNSGERGTSFAAPIVAGIAGLVKTVHPTYNGFSIMRAIEASSKAHSVGSWVTYGKVDAAAALNVGADTVAPKLTGVSPAQGAKVRGTVTVKVAGVSDAWTGIRGVDLYADGVWKAFDRFAPFELKYNSAGRNGAVVLRVRVQDKAGNMTNYSRTVTADNTAPTVKVTKAPKNKAKIKGTVKVSYTGSDKYGIKNYQLLINGKVVQTHTTTATPFSFVASKYSKTMTMQVRAYDVAGNSKLSTKYTYTR